MESAVIKFFLLIRESIYNEEISTYFNGIEEDEKAAFFRYIKKNKLEGVLFSSAMKTMKASFTKEEILEWKERSIAITLLESKKYLAIKKLVDESKKNNISPVFFKGPLLAKLYPNPLCRNSSDIDVFIYDRDKVNFLQLLTDNQYYQLPEQSKEMVPVYYQPHLNHKIEVHFSLWEDYTGPQMNHLDEMKLTNFDSLIEEEINGIKVLTLGHEEHLIYQMFHIIKHFSTRFVNVRYLVDVTLFVNAHITQLSTQEFWRKMKVLGYEVFCHTFFQLAVELLDMNEQMLNGAENIPIGNKEKLLSDMVHCGNQDKINSSWQIYSIITPYLQGDVKKTNSSFTEKLNMIFPGPNALPQWCSYARTYPILLPIAWMHKIIAYILRYCNYKIFHKNTEYKKIYGVKEKLSEASYRLRLMEEMKLL